MDQTRAGARTAVMTLLRVAVGVLAVAGVALVLGSVLRTVVLPRAVPARLARLVFLTVRLLLRIRLWVGRRTDYATRDRVFALQAPVGLFAQLFTWGVLSYLCFAGLFWALGHTDVSWSSIRASLEQSGSSMLTLGFDKPPDLVRHLIAFADAAVGLALLALVITYLPSLYGAFSRREALITKLSVRAGSPPSGWSLLARSWTLGRFDQLQEVWDSWQDWFIDVGETHTTFPQLGFFRSPHPNNHWVLAGEAVLDGAALLMTTCDVPRESRAELCLDAGVYALVALADFLGIPHRPPEDDASITLPRARFDEGMEELARLGVPLRSDADEGWRDFSRLRARYEPLLAVLGRMTDAPQSEWSSWSEHAPRHSPPLLRLDRR